MDRGILDYKFDPETGKLIKGDWEKLVLLCKNALETSEQPREVPNRYLSTDLREIEKRIIEMAIEHFVSQKLRSD